jgi:hypothetical protein
LIKINHNLYKIGTSERYLYYGFLQIIYIFLTELCFNNKLIPLKYILGLTLVPLILNNYIYSYFQNVFDLITNEKNNFVKKVLFEWISNTIVYLEKSCLNKQIYIKKEEIIFALDDISTLKSNITLFFQNILITYAMIYLRKKSKFYYKIVKNIYKFTYNEIIHDMTIKEANDMFNDVIINKKYSFLIKPLFIQSIIFMYFDKQDSEKITEYIKKIKFKLISTISLWSIASFFSGYFTTLSIVLISLLFVKFKRFDLESNVLLTKFFQEKSMILEYLDDRQCISILLTLSYGIFYNEPLQLSIINQFGGMLIYNDLILNLIKIIYILCNRNLVPILILIHKDWKITKYWICITSYILINIFNINKYTLIIFSILQFKYLYLVLAISMINNEDNYFRLLIIGYLLALIDGMISYQPKKVFEDVQIKMNKKIIDNIKDEHFNSHKLLDKQTQTFNIVDDVLVIQKELELVEEEEQEQKQEQEQLKYNYLDVKSKSKSGSKSK